MAGPKPRAALVIGTVRRLRYFSSELHSLHEKPIRTPSKLTKKPNRQQWRDFCWAPGDLAGEGTGFPNRATAWDVLAGQPDCMTGLQNFLRVIDENPSLRAAAKLRPLDRLRAELVKEQETCGLSDPVVL